MVNGLPVVIAKNGRGLPVVIAGGDIGDDYKVAGPKFAMFGTSITAQNTYNVLPPNNNPARVWYADGYATWARILTGQRINLSIDDNYGVNGNSFAQMLARIGDVIAADADYIFTEGGTNNFPTLTNEASYQTMVSEWVEIVTTLKESGAVPVVIPAPTRNAGVLTTAQLQMQLRFYNFQREFCRNNQGYLFCDYYGSWIDQASAVSAPIAGRVRSADGVHPNSNGAFYIGKALADLLNPILPPRPTNFMTASDIYNATTNPTGQLLISGTTNLGMLAGTGGVQQANAGLTYAGGGFANLNFFQRLSATSTATVTHNKENPRTDPGRMSGERQIVQIAANAGGGADEVYTFLYTMALPNFANGDWYYAEASIEVTGAPVNVNSLELHLIETRSAQTQFATDLALPATTPGFLPPELWSGVMRTTPIQKQSNATAIQLYLRARLNATQAASITFKVGDVVVRKVDPSFV